LVDRIKNFEKEGDNLSDPSLFIANAHNKIYAFYMEKKRLLQKKHMSQLEGVVGSPPPLAIRR